MIFQHEIKTPHDLGPDNLTGHPHPANMAWRNGGLRPSPQHAVGKLFVSGTRDDMQIGESLVSDHGYDQIVLVVGERDNETFRMFNSCFDENFFFGCVPHDVEHFLEKVGMCLAHFFEQLFTGIDDDIVRAGSMHLLRHVTASIANATDDAMTSEFADSFLHSASPN